MKKRQKEFCSHVTKKWSFADFDKWKAVIEEKWGVVVAFYLGKVPPSEVFESPLQVNLHSKQYDTIQQ